ncbi:MAG: hypothetical protein RLZZ241_1576 [Bacteroidota bacterium]|jgi:arsenate reductase-like glutaredoxin family protein
MNKIYYLKTCDTCRRILKEIEPGPNTQLREIGITPIDSEELNALYCLAGSFEALLNKRAQLFKARGLNKQILTESEIRDLLLEHYTFLKRPIVLTNSEIFIGNSAKTVALAKKALQP